MGATLDNEGQFHVYYISSGEPVQRFVTLTHDRTKQFIYLTPAQFLNLLAWGNEQRPVLEELSRQEESTL